MEEEEEEGEGEEEEEDERKDDDDKSDESILSESLENLETGEDVESLLMEDQNDSRREKIYSGLKWGR